MDWAQVFCQAQILDQDSCLLSFVGNMQLTVRALGFMPSRLTTETKSKVIVSMTVMRAIIRQTDLNYNVP